MGSGSAKKKVVRVVAAEISDGQGHYLITQRNPHAMMPLLWEFPGGKVEPGEDDAAALRREIREELGIVVDVHDRTAETTRDHGSYTLQFCCFAASIASGEPRRIDVWDFRWVSAEDFDRYRFPPADKTTIDRLLGLSEG
jgi:8-oxo-dGTP diphosphatase